MKLKLLNHLKLSKFISNHNFSVTFFCKYCFFIHLLYIIINDYSKCIKYTYYDYFCISVSLKSFNHTHEKLKLKLKTVIKKHTDYFVVIIEHFIVIIKFNTKFNCLFLQLKHNKSIFILKNCCITSELNESNDKIKNKDSFFKI